MLNVISAEALKFRRHRATWMLVWIFPIAVLVISLLAIAIQLVRGSPPAPAAPELQVWLENAADLWDAPPSSFVRFLTAAYIGVVFAGEYGWNTWKLIVPHRSRTTLIAAKYLVSIGLLYAAFLAAALIMMGLGWLEDVATGDPIPAGITFGGIAAAHWWGFVGGLPTVLFTVAFVSLAAILTRSMVAALVIGIVVVTLEQLFRTFAPVLSLSMPGAVEFLYQVLPGYHLGNLNQWAVEGRAQAVPFPSGEISSDWTTSLANVAAWTVALVASTFHRFRRQDIN